MAVRPFLLLSMTLLVLATPTGASTSPEIATYYLHFRYPERGSGYELYMNKNNTEMEGEYAGSLGAAESVQGFELVYSGEEPMGASVTNNSKGEAQVFVATLQPDRVHVAARLQVGNATCTGTSEEKIIAHEGFDLKYEKFVVPCPLQGTAGPDDKPELRLTIFSHTNYYVGYDEPRASRMDFSGLEPRPPSGAPREPGASPSEGVPAPSLLEALAVVILFAAAIRVPGRK